MPYCNYSTSIVKIDISSYSILILYMMKKYMLLFLVVNLFAFRLEDDLEKLVQAGDRLAINYPIGLSYINQLTSWASPQKMAASLGVPGYSYKHQYNFIVFAFWGFKGPMDIVKMWSDPIQYFGTNNPFGSTKDSFQKNMKLKYNAAGIKLLISAFGASQFPTTAGIDPTQCAVKLATFVNQNNLDGVDIDWQDNSAMQKGTGQQWLITFQRKLRQLLPTHIITHAPQAPYFCKEYYKNGAYYTVHQQVGSTIDFYNIQFYNQGNNRYDTYQTLFITSGGPFNGTSIKEIHQKRGVPLEKLVLGKPVTKKDADNTGYIEKTVEAAAVARAKKQLGWKTGVFFWQFKSEVNGQSIKTVLAALK